MTNLLIPFPFLAQVRLMEYLVLGLNLIRQNQLEKATNLGFSLDHKVFVFGGQGNLIFDYYNTTFDVSHN